MSVNELYFGDNLEVLRESIKDESIDLIYLDPPFNSQATYNVLFKAPSGQQSHAQIEAFEDTWHWGEAAERAFDEVMSSGNTDAAELLRAMRSFLKENDLMAYLAMMATRLLELHRALKPNGSVYLHCDPTASHYLKILLDAVFGPKRYLNEIIWRRAGSHNSPRSLGPIHDVIHAYAKTADYTFNIVRRPYMRGHVESRYKKAGDDKWEFSSGGNVLTGAGIRRGESGEPWRNFNPTAKGRHWAIPGFYEQLMAEDYRELTSAQKLEALYQKGLVKIDPNVVWPVMVRYLDERDGVPLQDIWAYQPYTRGTVWKSDEGIDEDVAWLGPTDPDRLGYQTQKPVGLLERILRTSSNEGDAVLDPFCGCGTAIHAAQKLNRRWIGIDITHLAISLIEKRLNDAFPGITYDVHGTPKDLDGARNLAKRDKHQFQWWAVSLVNAVPFGGKKKGADTGIDGLIYFKDFVKKGEVLTGAKTEKIIVSVKGGENVNVAMIRDLAHVVEREKAKMGLFITLAEPTDPMRKEALKEGYFESAGLMGKYLKLQILTIEELLSGKRPELPPADASSFAQAVKEQRQQGKLL